MKMENDKEVLKLWALWKDYFTSEGNKIGDHNIFLNIFYHIKI